MPRVKKINAENLNTNDYNRCYRLNYRYEGDMRDALVRAKQYPKHYPGRVYMIKDDQEKLLAWALVTEGKANFYTRRSERRKGYGRQLSKAIDKEFNIEDIEVGMHDDISAAFFEGTDYRKEWH